MYIPNIVLLFLMLVISPLYLIEYLLCKKCSSKVPGLILPGLFLLLSVFILLFSLLGVGFHSSLFGIVLTLFPYSSMRGLILFLIYFLVRKAKPSSLSEETAMRLKDL